jgi:hypothetical protein
MLTADERHQEDLAGDEVMVQGIDYTSVSPFCMINNSSLGSLEWCTSILVDTRARIIIKNMRI